MCGLALLQPVVKNLPCLLMLILWTPTLSEVLGVLRKQCPGESARCHMHQQYCRCMPLAGTQPLRYPLSVHQARHTDPHDVFMLQTLLQTLLVPFAVR